MTRFDVFNGDADGLCALHQLRLHNPCESTLITGVKRDIDLLKHVPDEATEVTVLDISLDKNRAALSRLLTANVPVQYFDHHFPGELPESENFSPYINTDPAVCTGLLVNEHLGGAHLPWAVAAAFGDNLLASAESAAAPLALSSTELNQLLELGTLLNYNGYGATLEDLHYPPVALYEALKPHTNPSSFIHEDKVFASLRAGYASDNEHAADLSPTECDECIAIYQLPDAPWARRISGVLANELANRYPNRAHALLTEKSGGFLVSVRAPLSNRKGADTVCRQFESGGGREAAAGINTLPPNEVDRFIACLRAAYPA